MTPISPASKIEGLVEAERHADDSHGEDERDVYQGFMAFRRKGTGFDVIGRTVGCTARYGGEPLLWVYPAGFQIAPQGKGNAHHREVRELRDRHFSELRATKDSISFDSDHFTWARFQAFITDVQRMIREASN